MKRTTCRKLGMVVAKLMVMVGGAFFLIAFGFSEGVQAVHLKEIRFEDYKSILEAEEWQRFLCLLLGCGLIASLIDWTYTPEP